MAWGGGWRFLYLPILEVGNNLSRGDFGFCFLTTWLFADLKLHSLDCSLELNGQFLALG